jgi:signal peptide peptidase SppA
MKTHHFLAFCLSTPWAMLPERMTAYASVLARRYGDKAAFRADVESEMTPGVDVNAGPRAGNARSGSIAVIPVYGTIVQRASQLGMCEGGTSTQQISSMLQAALADETISQIILDIDSPGGSVFGVGELADEIRAARGSKPIVAIANSMAASAAYWIGTAASEFYMTPGGQVGSIGVWTAHEDWSKAMEQEGVAVTLISAGKYKVEGHPYAPIDAEALAFQQSSVDDYYSAFAKAVAKGRNVPIDSVRNGMGQGRVLGASAASAENMVDGVMTMNDLIAKMQRAAKPARNGRASTQIAADIAAVS